MTSPFTGWSITTPADNMEESLYPALARTLQTVLGGAPSSSAGVLGTLTPYGTATSGWRNSQINDDQIFAANAYATTASLTTFHRDNTAIATLAFTEEISGPYFRWLYKASGGSDPITFTELMRLTGAGALVAGRNVAVLALTGSSGGTNNTGYCSTGFGVGPVTPLLLTTLYVSFSWFANNNTSGDGVQCAVYRNQGGVPSNGVGVGGDTKVWEGGANSEVGTNGGFNFAYPAIFQDKSLSVGTGYYYYIAYKVLVSNTTTATATNASGWVME